MARDLYVASWEQGGGDAWVARHGLSSAQYQAAFDDFTSKGYRLKSVSGYTAGGGQERYAAIWDKRPGPAWAARHGLSAQAYQQTFDELIAQGYRPKFISAYAVGGQPKFAGFWEKGDGPAWAARHGLNSAQYQQTFNDLTRQGFRLRWVTPYAVGGQDFYAAIWDKGGGPAWVARHGQTEPAFRQTAENLAAQGYDLICAGACTIGGKDRYAALWEKHDSIASVAEHGMTSATYQLRFNQLAAQNFRPRFVSGYLGDEAVDVILNFDMEQQQQANWCWAATAASMARFYDINSTWQQCEVANGQLNRNDCCGPGASGPCNVYGFLGDALSRVGCYVSEKGGTDTHDTLKAQMLQGRPVGIRVAWSGGGAHFIAATGVEDNEFVYVSDCGSGTTSLVDYDTLLSSYAGSGAWTHTDYTQP